jgi:hypothetical protein
MESPVVGFLSATVATPTLATRSSESPEAHDR